MCFERARSPCVWFREWLARNCLLSFQEKQKMLVCWLLLHRSLRFFTAWKFVMDAYLRCIVHRERKLSFLIIWMIFSILAIIIDSFPYILTASQYLRVTLISFFLSQICWCSRKKERVRNMEKAACAFCKLDVACFPHCNGPPKNTSFQTCFGNHDFWISSGSNNQVESHNCSSILHWLEISHRRF